MHLPAQAFYLSVPRDPSSHNPSTLPPTDNGDVACEGSIDVTEALVAAEAPDAEPGQGGRVGLWSCAGSSRGKGLCSGQFCG